MKLLKEKFVLSNGVEIPKIGFGTWQIQRGEICEKAVNIALKNGYIHIDTAEAYQNEDSVGKAIKESGIAREQIFITTKLPAECKNSEEAKKYFNNSLQKLGVDYVDLYLIHAPKPWDEMFSKSQKTYFEENVALWKVFEEFYRQGKIKAIGVSNFEIEDLKNIMKNCEIVPMVNQISYYIGNTQDEKVAFCRENNILIEGYSPFATGRILDNEIVKMIAEKYQKSVPQICMRYVVQKDVLPLPKSTHEKYIIENVDLDFEIDDDDMEYLDSLKDLVDKLQ